MNSPSPSPSLKGRGESWNPKWLSLSDLPNT